MIIGTGMAVLVMLMVSSPRPWPSSSSCVRDCHGMAETQGSETVALSGILQRSAIEICATTEGVLHTRGHFFVGLTVLLPVNCPYNMYVVEFKRQKWTFRSN